MIAAPTAVLSTRLHIAVTIWEKHGGKTKDMIFTGDTGLLLIRMILMKFI